MIQSLARWFQPSPSPSAPAGRPLLAADTHRGLQREHNEDSFLCLRLPAARDAMLAIADGMGGHDGGEIASHFAVRSLLEERLRCPAGLPPDNPKAAKELLRQGLARANQVIFGVNSRLGPGLVMGTTIVAVVFVADHAIIAHAGDSRCYRWRDQNLEQLTRDHTWVESMVQNGAMTPEEAAQHPMAGLLCNCLGTKPEPTPAFLQATCRPGDRYLLCSDGVSTLVPAADLADILRTATAPQLAVTRVIAESLRHGGTDNISAGVAFL